MSNGHDALQPVVFYWSGKTGTARPGHIAMQIGQLYLSHVPLPWSKGKDLGRRTKIDGVELAFSQRVRRMMSCACHTYDADEDKYGKPQFLKIPVNKVHVFPMMEYMSRTLSAMDRNPLSPPRPLQHFSPSDTQRFSIAFPRHLENYHYYQICDSALDPNNEDATLRGDRSNCATTVADCIGAGIPMEHQEIYKVIVEQYDPNKLFNVLVKVFGDGKDSN